MTHNYTYLIIKLQQFFLSVFIVYRNIKLFIFYFSLFKKRAECGRIRVYRTPLTPYLPGRGLS